MTITYPRIVLGDIEFSGDEILEAIVVEQFDPICATLPISTLEFTIFSEDASFSPVNPMRTHTEWRRKQPVVVYENVDGIDHYIGLYYLDEWEVVDRKILKFKCFDQIGLLDSLDFPGWALLPGDSATISSIINIFSAETGVNFEIDPDLVDLVVGSSYFYIHPGTYRTALQQVIFASGAYVLSARQIGCVKIGLLSHTEGYITHGLVSGIPSVGQSRVWQTRWRPSQWGGIDTVYHLTASEIGSPRTLERKKRISGVSINAYIGGWYSDPLVVFLDILDAGVYKIIWETPVSDLQIIGAVIDNSASNWAIITVTVDGAVQLTGDYIYEEEFVEVPYSMQDESVEIGMQNVVEVTDATLMYPRNYDLVEHLYEFYQTNRFIQKCRLYAPSIKTGSIVNVDTWFDQTLQGRVILMVLNLVSGFTADVEILGAMIYPYYNLSAGVPSTGTSRVRQRNFRPGIGGI